MNYSTLPQITVDTIFKTQLLHSKLLAVYVTISQKTITIWKRIEAEHLTELHGNLAYINLLNYHGPD